MAGLTQRQDLVAGHGWRAQLAVLLLVSCDAAEYRWAVRQARAQRLELTGSRPAPNVCITPPATGAQRQE